MAASRRTFIGFLLTGALFLVLYFILAESNRPAADDFYFLHAVKQQGILDMTWTAYTTWITRWTALPLTGFVFRLAGERFFWFHALTLLGLLATCFAWVRFISQRLSLRPHLFLVGLYAL